MIDAIYVGFEMGEREAAMVLSCCGNEEGEWGQLDVEQMLSNSLP